MMELFENSGGREPQVLDRDLSFENVLDTACDKLWEKKVNHSIRRIRELEDTLRILEKELDDLIPGGDVP
jgi:hypothetical protein